MQSSIIYIYPFTSNNADHIFGFKEFGNNAEDVPAEHIIVDDIDMLFETNDRALIELFDGHDTQLGIYESTLHLPKIKSCLLNECG